MGMECESKQNEVEADPVEEAGEVTPEGLLVQVGEAGEVGEVGASEVGQEHAEQLGDEALLTKVDGRVVPVTHFHEYGGEYGLEEVQCRPRS